LARALCITSNSMFAGSKCHKGLFTKSKTKIAIALAVFVVFLSAWAPWITDNYAVSKVVEKLGGPEARFNYLGQDMAVKDIPKEVHWSPFGRYVTFPGEAGWSVTFWGSIT